jgi:hypothetical protein
MIYYLCLMLHVLFPNMLCVLCVLRSTRQNTGLLWHTAVRPSIHASYDNISHLFPLLLIGHIVTYIVLIKGGAEGRLLSVRTVIINILHFFKPINCIYMYHMKTGIDRKTSSCVKPLPMLTHPRVPSFWFFVYKLFSSWIWLKYCLLDLKQLYEQRGLHKDLDPIVMNR